MNELIPTTGATPSDAPWLAFHDDDFLALVTDIDQHREHVEHATGDKYACWYVRVREAAVAPTLLMAAMRGHGWGDPLHIAAHPECTMCQAIRQAVGPRTAHRVMELAKQNSDHILELLDAEGASDEENWGEVERLLGIAEGDPYCAELRNAGEYEGMDTDIIEACANA